MKLSILILTMRERRDYLKRLKKILDPQVKQRWNDVEVLIQHDDEESPSTVGAKRNALLADAQGDYVCFIDDDDVVSNDYVSNILESIQSEPDCCSLRGVITTDNGEPYIFEHSIQYKGYKTNVDESPIKYERYPNHLNAIKRSIAIKYKFPLTNFGEDTDWSTQIFKGGDIKTEVTINSIMYHYLFNSKK
jgi:glycosyltransferase involved in cell wall biosynthesis